MNEKQIKVIQWLFSDDTGLSSKSLAAEYLGVTPYRCMAPLDPSDLSRCMRLIAIVPEIRNCVDTLAKKYDDWKRIASIWDKITQSMIDEAGINWEKSRSAPITYYLMH